MNEAYVNYVRYDVLGKDLLNASLNYVPSLKELYHNLTKLMPDYGSIKNWYVFSLSITIQYYNNISVNNNLFLSSFL